MSVWTWLHRIPRAQLDSVPTENIFHLPFEKIASETIHTRRAWHALHALLTGSEDGSDPPASWVIYDGSLRADGFSLSSAMMLNTPKEVSFISGYLKHGLDFEAFIAALKAGSFAHTQVYSFGGVVALDASQEAVLRKTMNEVRDFYGRAADAGDYVIKVRL